MMIIISCSLILPNRVCLKKQLTTQAMLELPKVARNCHGSSFVPGMSQRLAGMQLHHYCYFTATCVTCLLLICIQLHINHNEWCVNLTVCKFTMQCLICFWNMLFTDLDELVLWYVPSPITVCLWKCYQVATSNVPAFFAQTRNISLQLQYLCF